MPLYDYRCKNCGNVSEVLQGIGEAPLTDCDICGEPKLEKLPAAPAFSFKGGGWYKDLYGSKGSAEGGAKSEKKTETKSESKSEKKKPASTTG